MLEASAEHGRYKCRSGWAPESRHTGPCGRHAQGPVRDEIGLRSLLRIHSGARVRHRNPDTRKGYTIEVGRVVQDLALLPRRPCTETALDQSAAGAADGELDNAAWGGHEATDTGFAYAPVSQSHGHHHTWAWGGGHPTERLDTLRRAGCAACPPLTDPFQHLRSNRHGPPCAPPCQYQCAFPQNLQGVLRGGGGSNL